MAHDPARQALVKNLGRYEINQEEVRRMLSASAGSRTIASLMRDDPKTTADVIPTVNVIVNPSRDTSKNAMRTASEAAIHALKRAAQGLDVVEDLTPVTVSGKEAYRFTVEFDLGRPGGPKSRIRSQTYVVPCWQALLQISMSEALPAEEGQTFAAFLEGIEFIQATNR